MMRCLSRPTAAIAVSVILSAPLAAAACQGDCNGDGEVMVNELILGVNIANGVAQLGQCVSFDVNGDGEVRINELIGSVANALNGCNAPAPTPTATPSAGGPLPTRPPRPTAGPNCTGGYVEATFSDVAGVNTHTQPLTGTAGLTQVDGIITSGLARAFGGNAIRCPLSIDTIVRRFAWNLSGLPADVTAGQTFALAKGINFTDTTRPTVAWLDYFEVLPTDPLNNRGWRAESGTLTIDAIDADTVYFHAEGQMVPEASFTPGGTPATGTFRVRIIGTIDKVQRQTIG